VTKTLYLLRHLKSSWDEPGLRDFDRPLAPRGRKAGKKIARHLRRSGASPDIVLCSPAVRTRQTLAAVLPALGDPNVTFPEELYAASEETLLRAVRAVTAKSGSVLVIAHNPGLEGLAIELAGSGDVDALERLGERFPTGALATLAFRRSWADVGPGSGELVEYVVPRELG
jgi:phosphohistidine phosphatase